MEGIDVGRRPLGGPSIHALVAAVPHGADLPERAAAIFSVTHPSPAGVRAGADHGHCRRVAARLARYGPEAVATGWLHDLLQCTALTIPDLHDVAAFGIPNRVLDALRLLTPADGETAIDVVDRVRTATDPLAAAVKAADLNDGLDTDPTCRLLPATRLDCEQLQCRLMRPWSLQEAQAAARQGWNIRCNRCGSYGARWWRNGRPGWGALALCPLDALELEAELRRHTETLRRLLAVNYEQDTTRSADAGCSPPRAAAPVPGSDLAMPGRVS
jgi:hypothetical protein